MLAILLEWVVNNKTSWKRQERQNFELEGGKRRVLLRGIQLTFVQRFQQLYSFWSIIFVINTWKMRARNADRCSEASHMHWPHLKKKHCMITPFSQLNLSSIEHVWVVYHVVGSIQATILKLGHQTELIFEDNWNNASLDGWHPNFFYFPKCYWLSIFCIIFGLLFDNSFFVFLPVTGMGQIISIRLRFFLPTQLAINLLWCPVYIVYINNCKIVGL
jgi:hypothetical protein